MNDYQAPEEVEREEARLKRQREAAAFARAHRLPSKKWTPEMKHAMSVKVRTRLGLPLKEGK